MRNLLFSIMAVALFLALPTRQANAQAGQIINDSWSGYSEFQASYLQGGVGTIYHTATINVYSNSSISGQMKSVVDFDGTKYVSYTTLSGRVYESRYELYLSATLTSGGDELPNGLQWCGSSGTLTLYSDSDHSGYYILSGNMKDACDGSVSVVTLSNY